MVIRSHGAGERQIVAVRVIPVFSRGEVPDPPQRRDAGHLVRRGAVVGAIGLAIGHMVSDCVEARVHIVHIGSLAGPVSDTQDTIRTNAAVDREAILLHGIADQLLKLANPLLLTCGGRTMDLPFLRYRCFASGIALPTLHLSLANRLSYFDRYDHGWHVDLCDLLAGHGASSPLTLEELCALGEFKGKGMGIRENIDCHAMNDAAAIFSLFVQILCMMGRLTIAEFHRAATEIAATRDMRASACDLGSES